LVGLFQFSFMLALHINNERDEIIYDTLFSLFIMMMVLVALKGTRAVSRVPLRKDLFVG
jgi:uncharacterized membrane protein